MGIGIACHAGVGVAERGVGPGEHVVDHGGAACDLPQRTSSGELSDDLAFGVGEPEARGGALELVGCLAKQDLGGGVGEESAGDLGG